MKPLYKQVLLHALLICTSMSVAFTQVKTKFFREGIPANFLPTGKLITPLKTVQPSAEFRRLKENQEASPQYSNKFAYPNPVVIDVLKEAVIFDEGESLRYVLRLRAEEAINMSFQFGEFYLSLVHC